MGEWSIEWKMYERSNPLGHTHVLAFRPLIGYGSYLKHNDNTMTFTKDDAESMAEILNRQIQEATKHCIKQIEENKL
jgi:hypothetical protein